MAFSEKLPVPRSGWIAWWLGDAMGQWWKPGYFRSPKVAFHQHLWSRSSRKFAFWGMIRPAPKSTPSLSNINYAEFWSAENQLVCLVMDPPCSPQLEQTSSLTFWLPKIEDDPQKLFELWHMITHSSIIILFLDFLGALQLVSRPLNVLFLLLRRCFGAPFPASVCAAKCGATTRYSRDSCRCTAGCWTWTGALFGEMGRFEIWGGGAKWMFYHVSSLIHFAVSKVICHIPIDIPIDIPRAEKGNSFFLGPRRAGVFRCFPVPGETVLGQGIKVGDTCRLCRSGDRFRNSAPAKSDRRINPTFFWPSLGDSWDSCRKVGGEGFLFRFFFGLGTYDI